MTDPELPAPGEVKAVGPVAAGPMAAPPAGQVYLTLSRGAGRTQVTRIIVSPHEQARLRERQDEAVRERQRKEREYWDRLDRAEETAHALLTRLLSDTQRATLARGRFFDVTAISGRRYRIYCGGSREGNILWIDGRNRRLGTFCVAPAGPRLPVYDAYLGQMLLIATNEPKFLSTAVFSGQRHPTWGPVRRFIHHLGY